MARKHLSLSTLREIPLPGKPVLFQTATHIIYPHNPATVVYDPIQGQWVTVPDVFGNPSVQSPGQTAAQGLYVNNGLQLGTTASNVPDQPLRFNNGVQSPCAGGGTPLALTGPASGAGTGGISSCPSGCSSGVCPASVQVPVPVPAAQTPVPGAVPIVRPSLPLSGFSSSSCPSSLAPGCPSSAKVPALRRFQNWLRS